MSETEELTLQQGIELAFKVDFMTELIETICRYISHKEKYTVPPQYNSPDIADLYTKHVYYHCVAVNTLYGLYLWLRTDTLNMEKEWLHRDDVSNYNHLIAKISSGMNRHYQLYASTYSNTLYKMQCNISESMFTRLWNPNIAMNVRIKINYAKWVEPLSSLVWNMTNLIVSLEKLNKDISTHFVNPIRDVAGEMGEALDTRHKLIACIEGINNFIHDDNFNLSRNALTGLIVREVQPIYYRYIKDAENAITTFDKCISDRLCKQITNYMRKR